jgi:uncharacterized repeat protein (TIGR03803 family)
MIKFNWGMRACGVFLLWAATAVALPAQTPPVPLPAPKFTTLLAFDVTNGAAPNALVQATDGNLYGTTAEGGDHFCNARGNYGCGTVFKITTSGKLTTLYNFCPHLDCADGKYASGLIQGTDGNFYGTTFEGGAHFCKMRKRNYGCGTIFKITPASKLKTLYSFCPQGGKICKDGAAPDAGLIQATDGNFYGTTSVGGANNDGTIFKITPSGMLTTLHSFDGTDGATPYAGLVQATNGNFYGTTAYGGASSDCYGGPCGTVFKITPSGTLTTLHSFDGTDGEYPYAGLVQGTDGNFYGTTFDGGGYGVYPGGTIFKITPSGILTTLYNFCAQSNCPDGYSPIGLVRGNDGNFYGTTDHGGANGDCGGIGCGTVFTITPSGTLTTIYSFCSQSNCTDGEAPYAGLIQATNGSFYGATDYGGAIGFCEYGEGCGTIWSLSVGLGPYVETQPTSGTVGAAVNILGTDLTDATSVAFNGTAATFTVVSKSLITTTVPAGATTGKVKVTLPHGTRSSNVPFRVK